MAWDKGFNFRATSGYVTDGTNETYVFASDAYPVTRNGVTFGWDGIGAGQARDRDSTIDRRLAGIVYQPNNGSQYNFRVDLEAADDYIINLAMGDTEYAQTYQYYRFIDNTTVLRTIDDTDGTLQDNYDDATGVNRTEALWPADNAPDTQTFSSTIFKLLIGSPVSQTLSTTVTHLFLSRSLTLTGRISRYHNLNGLGGQGQQTFNPMN